MSLVETISEVQVDIEWRKCRQSCLYFLTKYGTIRDKSGIIRFEPWKHLVYLLECLAKERFIIILKAKQVGITWTMAGANLHLAMFHQGANIFSLSKGEDEATESLDYSRFILSQLPDFLRLRLGKDQASLLTFPSMHSKIRALPSTKDAGVGFGGASRVVFDEFEYHDYDDVNYAEIYPAVERGGQLVILSTADNEKMDTKFKMVYEGARVGDNKFFKIFFPRDVLPERTQEWYDGLDLPLSQKECRFPLTEQDALTVVKSRRFFDENAISDMYADVMTPLEHELSSKYSGLVRIYRLPSVGKKYCLATDPSEGKDDPHCIMVIDGRTKEQVAQSHGKIPADQVAVIHDELVRFYNNAFNTWESGPGGAGGILTTKLKELDTPNRCPSLNVAIRPFKLDTRSGKMGWWTSKSLWEVGIWRLEEAVRLREFIPHSKELIDEFGQFKQAEGEAPSKVRGGHDDYIDASLRVLLLSEYMPRGEMRVSSFLYQE